MCLCTSVKDKDNEAAYKGIVLPAFITDNGNFICKYSDKISALIKELDSVPSSIDSFNITLDDEGNILDYRFSGGGGEITVTQRNGQKTKIKKQRK